MQSHRVVVVMGVVLALTACGSSDDSGLATGSPRALDVHLEFDGITFHVTCANEGSLNMLHVVPTGLEIVNDPVVVEIDGIAHRAEVADLDGNGSPEVYVFVTSAGSGSYGSVVGWAANNRKSLSGIHLPGFAPGAPESVGYMGHDEFTIEGARLVRSFPIYRAGDTNAGPSGGTRRLEYGLKAGEAGWLLLPQAISGD